MAQQHSHIDRFIDRLGHYFEEQGTSRSAGQIFAWMLISEEPQSLDDLAEALQISKGSASLGTRMWETTGFIERVSIPGDRKTYYRVHPRVSERLTEAAIVKYRELVEILEEAIEQVGDDRPNAKAKLDAFADIFRFLTKKIPEVIDEWATKQAKE